MISKTLKEKILRPLRGFLTQGLSSEKLSLCLALGITLSTFPVLGTTTILCAAAAVIFKLNLPVIQFANYLAYPLQLFLLIPFYFLGELLFNAQSMKDIDAIRNMLTGGMHKEMIKMLLDSTLHAVSAWLLISPLVFLLIYKGISPILIKLNSTSPRFKRFRR